MGVCGRRIERGGLRVAARGGGDAMHDAQCSANSSAMTGRTMRCDRFSTLTDAVGSSVQTQPADASSTPPASQAQMTLTFPNAHLCLLFCCF